MSTIMVSFVEAGGSKGRLYLGKDHARTSQRFAAWSKMKPRNVRRRRTSTLQHLHIIIIIDTFAHQSDKYVVI